MTYFATAQQNLDMAAGILKATIAKAQSDQVEAMAQLQAAVDIQDSLPLTGESGKEYGASLWVKHGGGWQNVLLQAMPNAAE
jgi:hypothetical protein